MTDHEGLFRGPLPFFQNAKVSRINQSFRHKPGQPLSGEDQRQLFQTLKDVDHLNGSHSGLIPLVPRF
jgi:hypothetical protein